jgi:hypothetical protein
MKLLFFIFILFLTVGCRKYLDWEIVDKGRKPVVNAIFITDSVPKIYIYQSVHILDKPEKNVINQAQVQLINNQNQFIIPYNNIQQCYKLDSLIIAENTKYNIKIQTPLGNIENEINTVAKINNIYVDTTLQHNEFEKKVNIKIRFKDDTYKKNYYIFYVTNNTDIQYISINDMSIEVINGIAFFTDELFNGDYKTIQTSVYLFGDNYSYSTNFLDIYLINADEHSFKYFYSTNKQINSKFNPFSEPVMIYSNIVNGYGIIGSYSVSKSTIVVQ